MPSQTLPPFPDDVPTHPLLVIDYELIKSGNNQEIDKLWKAATELGFWYMKNHGAEFEVKEMFDMGAETMALPLDEKMKFEQGDEGQSFGYKAAGGNASDEYGTPDTVEFINIARDDVLSYPTVTHRTYPSTVDARMESTIIPFVTKALEVNDAVIGIFEAKLGLPAGALLAKHAHDRPSPSEARCIKNPPKQPGENPKEVKVALGAHTDFGSLSFLHNGLGGLQVLPPGQESWHWVRPLPGHAICNIGDALTVYSGGILRSNLHRVVFPPGEQAFHTRWSLVFFTRPCSDEWLEAMTKESSIIKNAISRLTPEEKQKYEPMCTASEWFQRRIKNQRLKNRTGPETWRASRGMEHKSEVI